jgi:hypothetical protein
VIFLPGGVLSIPARWSALRQARIRRREKLASAVEPEDA